MLDTIQAYLDINFPGAKAHMVRYVAVCLGIVVGSRIIPVLMLMVKFW